MLTSHKNILEYEHRPFKDLVDMREQLILNWNSVVDPDDIVYHLGDVGFFNKELGSSIITRLNGHKYLILGNHDNHSKGWFQDIGFEEVKRWDIISYKDNNILLTHRPYANPEGVNKEDYNLHFYGHVHGKGNEPGLYPTVALNGACLCVERWNYKPVDIDTVIDMCKKAPSHFNEDASHLVESDP